ncbi:MAG: segregation/condensation protein A [Clostridia bacterium]|nr:segregation/condensation protein A [Clostridia bacterium]
MDAISYRVGGFEGPLDLLLHLLQKNKLNIYDIPIARVLDQYMAAIHEMQEADLEVASEFLEMAARLVQMKSYMLLPKHEEAEQMKAELTGELIEYQLCQEAARRLAMQAVGGDIFVREPDEPEPDPIYRRVHRPEEILAAYFAAAGRGQRRQPPPVQAFHGVIARKIVSVSSKIVYVLRRLREGTTVSYRSLYEKAESRSDLVATFLAVLELIKANRIRVDGEGEDQTVQVGAVTGDVADMELTVGGEGTD